MITAYAGRERHFFEEETEHVYRLYLLEAAVYGCNMSVPYGSWMGNTIKDAFWPPRSVTCEVQDFLFNQEQSFPGTPVKGAAVIYSFYAAFQNKSIQIGKEQAAVPGAAACFIFCMHINSPFLMPHILSSWFSPGKRIGCLDRVFL